jgi:hypothetical protein
VSRPTFPPHVRTVAAAVEYLPVWAETIGGTLIDGLQVTRGREEGEPVVVKVGIFHVSFETHQTVLTVGLDMRPDLTCPWYTFDLRRVDGRLLWRHDNHPGHQAEHGGRRTHLHIGPDEDHRVPVDEPVTLEDIAAKVVSTHINLK